MYKISKTKYKIVDFKPVITENKYNAFDTNNSEYLPILTYHVTTSNKNVNSIIDHGYLLPNDLHPISNQKIKMAHGNFYGTGIYSFMSISSCSLMMFFESDANCDLQIIVNLVNIRKVSFFSNNISLNNNLHTTKNGDVLPFYLTPDIDGFYTLSTINSDDKATCLIYDNDLMVLGSPKDIIPVCVVRLSETINPEKIHNFALSDKLNNKLIKKKVITEILPHVDSIRIFDDIYLITPNNASSDSHISNIKTQDCIKKKDNNDYYYYFLIPDFSLTVNNKNILEHYIATKNNHFIFSYNNKKYSLCSNLSTIKLQVNTSSNIITQTTNNFTRLLNKIIDLITANHSINIIYLFADKLENFDVEQAIKKYEKILKFARIVVKVIVLDNSSENTAIKIKYHLQTETIFDNSIYSVSDIDLSTILAFIDEENIEINKNLHSYSCEEIWKSGFLKNLHQLPEHNIMGRDVLYKGCYQKYIKVNNNLHKTNYIGHIDDKNKLLYIEGYNHLLNTLCSFRNFIIVNPKLMEYYLTIFEKLCTSMQQNLKIISNFVQKDNINEKIVLIKKIKTINFRLNRIISDVTAFTKTSIKGKWYSKLINMKYAKNILKRSKTHNKIVDTSETLCETQDMGIGIRCMITSASEIEPWLIKVIYVSPDVMTLGHVFTMNELCQEIKDSTNNVITDILLLKNDYTIEMKSYYSYVFTRNIYTYLPSQPCALITNTWVHLLEKFFCITNTLKTNEDCENIMSTCKILFDNIFTMFELLKDFYKNKNIQQTLDDFDTFIKTGKNNFITFNQVVCIFLNDNNKFSRDDNLMINVLNNENFIKCFVECIIKSARSFIKTCVKNNISINSLIFNVFGIDINTNFDDYSFNLDRASKISGKFYSQMYQDYTKPCKTLKFISANSPFSFVAIFEFFKLVKNGLTKDEIFTKFVNKEISMNNCLKYFNNNNGKELQVSLYLHSLKHYQDSNYVGSYENIIEECRQECIDLILLKRTLIAQRNNKKVKKLEKIMEEGEDFIKYHRMPTLFTQKQVDELNESRASNDKLELLASGLLKHHCCYLECPKYLHNFQTEKDKVHNRRNGLMNHLKYDSYLNNYFPAFHLLSKQLVKQSRDYNDFKRLMEQYYNKTNYSRSYKSCNNLNDTLINIYEFYKNRT